MKTKYIAVEGTENGIDFDAHYKVRGWNGVAFFLLGWECVYEPVMCYGQDEDGNEVEMESGEFDEVANRDNVIAVMVGDDRRHVVDVKDLEVLEPDKFCRSCGQIGCGCNVYV